MAARDREVDAAVAAAAREAQALLRDPVFQGKGVPRGDGRLVFPIPGMFGNWAQMQPLYDWLHRIGYEPSRVVVSLDRGCAEKLTQAVETALIGATRGRPRGLAIIGHSGGGVLACALAARLGTRVSHLVLLGAQVRAVLDDPWPGGGEPPERIAAGRAEMEDAWAKVRQEDPTCGFPRCGCAFMRDLRQGPPPSTRVLSIYSTTDPSNSAWSCHLDGAHNIGVDAPHVGLILNRQVYRAIARFLADRG